LSPSPTPGRTWPANYAWRSTQKPYRCDCLLSGGSFVAYQLLVDSVAPGQSSRRDREAAMDDHIYRVIQIVGSSEKSIDDAIQRAIARASKTLRELRWFEVVETRGHIEKGKVHHFQVTLKVGFTLDGD